MNDSRQIKHDPHDLIQLFNACFETQYATRLVLGFDEPLYRVADAEQPYHAILFAHGYFSSALHECAHWFIAGRRRRQQEDYGYWYTPDGRTAEQQALFFQVEVKPQALEWILSDAAYYPFQYSLDNLNGIDACINTQIDAFKQAVCEQVDAYRRRGLPKRAALFHDALRRFYDSRLVELAQSIA